MKNTPVPAEGYISPVMWGALVGRLAIVLGIRCSLPRPVVLVGLGGVDVLLLAV
jgi:hypothetical protein